MAEPEALREALLLLQRRHDAAERRLADFAAIFQSTEAIIGAASPDDVAVGMFSGFVAASGAEAVAVLKDHDGTLVCQRSNVDALTEVRLQVGPMLARCLGGESMAIPDIRRSPELAPLAAATHLRSGALIPFQGPTRRGIVLLLKSGAGGFQAADARRLKTFGLLASQGVAALQRHQLATERALADAQRSAALEADASKSVFLSNMSHEIRTPLNGVLGLAGALAQTSLDDAQREMVDLIRGSGQVLLRVVSDILDLSKAESGKLGFDIAPFDLGEAIEAAAQVMRIRADDKGLDFSIHYGPTARGLFDGDMVRLQQIVANLTSNAVKFTERGSVRIEVDVEESDAGPAWLNVWVRDTGIGFDEETAKRLFQRFQQADGSITRRFGGTGLGLAISHELSVAMGGEIKAHAVVGEGSAFGLRLPLPRSAPLADYDARPRPEARPPAAPEDSRLNVLLVEDHPVNQRVACLILEPFGMKVAIAGDGAAALDRFREESFDIILMDMQMPVMDGLASTRAIRALEAAENRPRTPIAILSANAMQEHVAAAMDAGADCHIPKPIEPDRLLGAIDLALSATRHQQATATAP